MAAVWKKGTEVFAATLPDSQQPLSPVRLLSSSSKLHFIKIDVAKRTLFKPLCFQNSDYKSTLTVDYLVQH